MSIIECIKNVSYKMLVWRKCTTSTVLKIIFLKSHKNAATEYKH